jgi:hypothetical protein
MTPTVFNADIGESIFLEEMNNDHKIECISINHLLSYERSSSTAKKPHFVQCEVKTSSSCRTYNKKKKKRRRRREGEEEEEEEEEEEKKTGEEQ